MNYYAVGTKTGHVGRFQCRFVEFAVSANSRREAAAIARQIPRVKHDHQDAIRYVEEISYAEFLAILEENQNDPYLQCKSKQEQKSFELTDVVPDEFNIRKEELRMLSRKKAPLEYRLKRNRILLNDALSQMEAI